MNKTIIININSIVFHIEEDAYENLRSYMIEIKKHFGKSEDSREILEDIENRIAEMFSERIHSGRKEVINMLDVSEVIAQMGRVSDFETDLDEDIKTEERVEGNSEPASAFEEPTVKEDAGEPHNQAEPNFAGYSSSKKLMRDMDDKVFGGVCSGLAHYFNIESKWIRIMFVLFFLFGGSGVILYFVLWAVMPKALTRADKLAMRGEQANLQNFKKSFDEEMKNLKENFSGAGDQFNNTASAVGDVFGKILRVFGKIFAVFGLIVSGSTVVGMFVVYVFNVLNIMGYQNPIYFPPLEVLEPTSAFLAVTAFTFAVGIPFLALFFLMIRILFKSKPMNNYASLSLFATWVVSIIMILYFVIVTQQDFREESTISVEKPLEKQDIYTFSQNDVRVIKASDNDFSQKKFDMKVNDKILISDMRSDISIRFEAIDSLKAPYLQYNYIAKGTNYGEASARASQINYQVNQKADQVVFDSHFSLQKKQLYRDQHVSMMVYLPVGTQVMLHDDLDNKIRDIWAYNCENEEGQKLSAWIMTKGGLRCIKELAQEKLDAEKEAKEKAEKGKKKEKKENKEEDATDESEDASTIENEA